MTNMRDVLDKVEERGFSEGEKKGSLMDRKMAW